MPYVLCPREHLMLLGKAILEPRLLQEVGALGILLWLRLHFNDRRFGNFGQCHRIQQAFPISS